MGQSRSLPWQRRTQASLLLAALRDPRRGFSAVVVGEPHRAFYGVEPICRALTGHGLKIAASTYYKAKAMPPSARAVSDARLSEQIRRVHAANYGVYGARKVWRQLRRDGVDVARCTVERLMRDAGLRGVVRGRKIRTTVTDPGHERAGDLVARDFTAATPNRCWVADFTHVATFAGVVYVAFVVDVYSRAIVGWSAATNKRTPLVLDALDMGLWRRDRAGRTVTRGLIHHSDAGSPNIRRSGSPPTSSPPASTPPSAPLVTPSTTRSWNPRSACTRPN